MILIVIWLAKAWNLVRWMFPHRHHFLLDFWVTYGPEEIQGQSLKNRISIILWVGYLQFWIKPHHWVHSRHLLSIIIWAYSSFWSQWLWVHRFQWLMPWCPVWFRQFTFWSFPLFLVLSHPSHHLSWQRHYSCWCLAGLKTACLTCWMSIPYFLSNEMSSINYYKYL